MVLEFIYGILRTYRQKNHKTSNCVEFLTVAATNSKQYPMARDVVVVAADTVVLRDFILPPLRKFCIFKVSLVVNDGRFFESRTTPSCNTLAVTTCDKQNFGISVDKLASADFVNVACRLFLRVLHTGQLPLLHKRPVCARWTSIACLHFGQAHLQCSLPFCFIEFGGCALRTTLQMRLHSFNDTLFKSEQSLFAAFV